MGTVAAHGQSRTQRHSGASLTPSHPTPGTPTRRSPWAHLGLVLLTFPIPTPGQDLDPLPIWSMSPNPFHQRGDRKHNILSLHLRPFPLVVCEGAELRTNQTGEAASRLSVGPNWRICRPADQGPDLTVPTVALTGEQRSLSLWGRRCKSQSSADRATHRYVGLCWVFCLNPPGPSLSYCFAKGVFCSLMGAECSLPLGMPTELFALLVLSLLSLMVFPGHFLCAWSRKPESAQPPSQLCGVARVAGLRRPHRPQGSDLYEAHLLA